MQVVRKAQLCHLLSVRHIIETEAKRRIQEVHECIDNAHSWTMHSQSELFHQKSPPLVDDSMEALRLGDLKVKTSAKPTIAGSYWPSSPVSCLQISNENAVLDMIKGEQTCPQDPRPAGFKKGRTSESIFKRFAAGFIHSDNP